MKITGLIGGLGPEATIDYYRQIISAYQAATNDGTFPPLLINSMDVNRVLRWAAEEQLEPLANYLAAAIDQLAAAGAQFAAITANTPHIVFDEVEKRSRIPLISIVETACAEARSRGLRRVGLLGTRSTMQGSFYPKVFSRHAIELVLPRGTDLDFTHDAYKNEMVKGIFRPETRVRMMALIDRLRQDGAVEAVILAGTEMPILLRGDPPATVPLLDTTQIHVKAIVREMLS